MRPTRDVDLLGLGSSEVERLGDIFRSICAEPVVDHGVTFDPGSVDADPNGETHTMEFATDWEQRSRVRRSPFR